MYKDIDEAAYEGILVKHNRKEKFLMNAHFHSYYEMFYLLDGERFVFVRNHTYHVMKGDLLLIPCNELHRTMDAEQSEYEKLEICFYPVVLSPLDAAIDSRSLLAPFERGNLLLRLDPEGQAYFSRLFFQLKEERKKRGKFGYTAQLSMLLSQILIFLERFREDEPRQHITPQEYIHVKAADMIRYVNENYKNHVTLGMLAERYQYHPSYVSTLFKKITGFTFQDYMNQMRVKASQQLLENTDIDIMEVCMDSGFNNLSHYGRIFKRIVGKSPSEYRKSARYFMF